jgi:excisionase family DNA binding protein
VSKIGDRNRAPRKIATREAAEFNPAISCRRSEATPFETEAVAFYTVAQLAIRWAISERQVHRYFHPGDLIATRFGRSIRISAAEVARFEASRRVVR